MIEKILTKVIQTLYIYSYIIYKNGLDSPYKIVGIQTTNKKHDPFFFLARTRTIPYSGRRVISGRTRETP